ncbi:MAG: type IV pilus twitching motility protein PilT [Gammaproteobacteria bacterium]|nr:type IV pilus twitching motility protein PilT [Gammaproteobacteria bacterium]
MDINSLLEKAVQHKASDVHLTSDTVPWWRIDGNLAPIEGEAILTLAEFKKILTQLNSKFNAENNEQDFAYALPSVARFRVNVFKHANGLSAALRVINLKIPTLADLGMGSKISKLCNIDNGLILVTGPTGSGKSTTLAAMINYINETQKRHMVTIEEPIEYMYQSKNSLIQQREVGAHTDNFQNALRAVLREDPDVILIGEMRDLETIRLALTAAETGHLVFGTLHTSSAVGCINRIIDVFSGDEKSVVRAMLAESLKAVIAQTLLPIEGGGRVALQELMIATPAVRNLIREDKTHQIASVIETGANVGMQSFAQALKELQRQHKILQE